LIGKRWALSNTSIKQKLARLLSGSPTNYQGVQSKLAGVLGRQLLMIRFFLHTPVANSFDHDELLLSFVADGGYGPFM
jgi:hypothetical protein